MGFTRKIACTLYPTATNSITPNGQIQIDTSSTFKSSSIKFRLNQPFSETTSDGRNVKTTAVLYGNRLIKDQVWNEWIIRESSQDAAIFRNIRLTPPWTWWRPGSSA